MKPLIIVATDLHIKETNGSQIIDLMNQLFTQAKKNGLNQVFIGGDIFDGRKAQPLENLQVWQTVLNNASDQSIKIIAIAGNHDKKDYTSVESYLDIFSNHPSFKLVREFEVLDVKGVKVGLVPYFVEKTHYIPILKQVKADILLTHVAIDGVKNNDGSEVEGVLDTNLFKNFKLVLVGHYHNRSRLDDNIHYIGSIAQNNHGETTEKGFCLIYDDLSVDYIQSEFKRYETVKIDLDSIDKVEFNKIKKEYTDHTDNIRFEIVGSEEACKALDKREIEELGIKVKIKYKEIDVLINKQDALNFEGFNSSKILQEWEEFSEKNEYDTQKGLSMLQSVF